MVAGAFAKLLTTPVQNIVTRKQTAALKTNGGEEREGEEVAEIQSMKPVVSSHLNRKRTPSMTQIARTIKKEKGLAGFWSGYSASLVLTLNPALTFLLHSLLSRIFLRANRARSAGSDAKATLSPQLTFLVAALSKAVASSVTYPVGLAKARAQAGSAVQESPKFESPYASYEGWHERSEHGRIVLPLSRVLQSVVGIAQAEGPGALYSGLGGEVLKGFLGHGLTMLLKQRVHIGVVQLWGLLARMLQSLKRKS